VYFAGVEDVPLLRRNTIYVQSDNVFFSYLIFYRQLSKRTGEWKNQKWVALLTLKPRQMGAEEVRYK
jgi:hypothetical protein